jgi:hypothetical protein|tara:strand:- start:363 stop:557 length:195 start_codon:yes stop_codon:yes gene_type:complete
MKLSYNNWMRYIHSTLTKNDNPKEESKFGEVGARTSKQIQEEIEYLQELDKQISNRVRASYSIK